MIGGQILIVFVGGAAFSVRRINGVYWAISVIIGAFSLPVAVIVRLLPTAPFERFLIKMRLYPDPNALPTTSPDADEHQYNEGIEKVKTDLHLLSSVRGNRTPMVFKSRSAQLEVRLSSCFRSLILISSYHCRRLAFISPLFSPWSHL